MKKLQLLLLCLIGLCLSSCGNDDDTVQYKSNGIILGLDMATCACCGNWLIQIDDSTNVQQFETLPDDSNIDLSTAEFPLNVRLNWSESDAFCEDYIIVEAITID